MRNRRLATALGVLGCTLAATPSADAGGPGKWTRISSPNQVNIDQPGYSRTSDDVLHVVVKEPNGANDNLTHVAISANGTVLGRNPVEQSWSGISDPALVTESDGTSIDAFWGGIRSTNSGETNDELNWSLSGDGGESWSLVPGTVASEPSVYANSMGAARLFDVMWQSWTGFSHRGTNPSVPPVDLQARIGGGCCAYNANVATNETTNEVVAAWFSNADPQIGVWTQRLDPASGAPLGAPVNMPGSVVDFEGTPSAHNLDDRTPIASLGTRGFFVAYPAGYPSQNNVRVWRVGAPASKKLAGNNLADVSGTTITATPDGRLWVALTSEIGGKRRVLAIRSNVGATKWGQFVVGKPPKKTDTIWSIYADGNPSGAVDLLTVASTTGDTLATFHSQLEPGLSLAGPEKLARKKKTQTFTVTDAGDPVGGAKVKVAGESGKTNANGKVDLTLGPFPKKTKHAGAKASKDGYTTRERSFSLKIRAMMPAMRLGLAIVLAGLASLAFGAASADADVVWLCKPGIQDNPCRDSLETTVYDTQGSSRVENPPLPAAPPIDCFYVYPTVSEQPGANANKDKDPEILAIARYQAARYSQVCRVYAPVYRQQTLASVGAGGNADALKLAYGDVEEAWRDYIANYNNGRGVVLIGHSQGTRMLRQLMRRQVDPSPAQLRLLVSSILLGGNVLVRRGQKAGGDFQNVPACTRAGEVGCVMAWSTFNDTPPPNSRFGRPPAEDTSGFGLPAGPDYEVLCTNPASLGTNERRPLTTYVRGEPFPGFIGLLLTETYGGMQPSAPTAWLEPQDHYTGRCETRDGANVLMLEPVGGARKLNPAPDPTWGLHIIDANIALGQLVDVVAGQSAAYRAKRPAATGKPRLKLRVHASKRGPRRCIRRGARVRLAGPDLPLVKRVAFRVGRRSVTTDRRAPFRATVRRPALRGKVIRRLRAIARLGGGARVALVRHVRVCRE